MNKTTKRMKKIYMELDAIKDDEKNPSFIFSYEEKGSIATIGRSSFAHDVSLIFSLIKKIERGNRYIHVLLLLRLLDYIISAKEKEETSQSKMPENVVIQ